RIASPPSAPRTGSPSFTGARWWRRERTRSSSPAAASTLPSTGSSSRVRSARPSETGNARAAECTQIRNRRGRASGRDALPSAEPSTDSAVDRDVFDVSSRRSTQNTRRFYLNLPTHPDHCPNECREYYIGAIRDFLDCADTWV